MALSDPSGTLASPLTTLRGTTMESAVSEVVRLSQAQSVEAIVVGIPVSMRGSEERQARLVRSFVRRLRDACAVPVHTWDERLSSVEAGRLLRQAGVEPSRERGRVDAAAAAVILQAWLDTKREG